uniref:CSON011799 protein n=1 Tax=Culicoides sonorensis TaxID=179676 RepID=A0A336M413_CULSO
MASSENSDDGGGHLPFPSYPIFGGNSVNTSNEYMQIDFRKSDFQESYHEMKVKLANLTAEKQRLEHDLLFMKKEVESEKARGLNTYREYNQLQMKLARYNELITDPQRCIKLVDDLTVEKTKLQALLKESETEVTTVLSERGTVLKENQKLYDKNETLKKELEKANRARDEAVKEVATLRDKIEMLESRNDFSKNERKDRFDLETAVQDIEKLKKALDKAEGELAKAEKEIKTAKERRDWAITEREKIVLERDSIRMQCDAMRKERDNAISKSLKAYIDQEDKDKVIRELREKIEQLEGYPLEGFDPYQQFDTETVEVDIARIPSNADMGLILEGTDDVPDENSNSADDFVSVAAVEPDSIFAGKLRVNDYICQINDMDCSSMSKRTILKAIRTSAPHCTLTVKRKKIVTKRVFSVKLNLDSNRNHGMEFEPGVYISKIEPNSLAAKETRLSLGDRVLSINNKAVDSFKDLTQISQCINESRNNILTLVCVKDVLEKPHDGSIFGRNALHERGRLYNRMINCSTQTDNMHSNSGSINNNNNQLSMDYNINNNHFLPANLTQFNNSSTNTPFSTPVTSSTSSTGKSASKRVSGMFKNLFKIPDKENDALAYFDSVLESDQESSKSPPTKDSIVKRLKRKDRNKTQSEKYIGTWPRVTANPSSHESHSGTIVHPRKKEKQRQTVYNIFDDCTPSHENSQNYFVPSPPPVAKVQKSQQPGKLNRNSNPIPADVNRRILPSKYQDISDGNQTLKAIPQKYRSILYDQTKPNPMNRHSLNLQNLQSSQGQHSLDFIPIKNSIDLPSSHSISKSPVNHQLRMTTTPRDSFLEMYVSKSQSKFASDTESIPEYSAPGNTSTLPNHLRNKAGSSQSNRAQNHILSYSGMYGQNYNKRYPSPSTVVSPVSDILGLPLDTMSMSHHSHGSSIDYPNRYSRIQTSKEEVPASCMYDVAGTFPRKKENQRIRIPSNQSMTSRGSGVKLSNGSIDCGSERASPMPIVSVRVIEEDPASKRNSMPVYNKMKPYIGMLRVIQIDKVDSPLGIKIVQTQEKGGIFISSVTEGSLASQIGLQVGDQLLEVCGLNVRSATYEFTASILRQCRESITMRVQYYPDKFEAYLGKTTEEPGSPTPQNSPQMTRSIMSTDSLQREFVEMPQPPSRPIMSQRSIRSSQLSQKSKDFSDSLEHPIESSSQSSPNNMYKEQPRVLFMETRNTANLGISLLGGNAYGIFVHSVKQGSIADQAGLRVGDQILEYNGTDLRRATAETAAFELAKPADKVTVLVQYNPQKCNQIKDKPGDSLYIRVGFDRNIDLRESELAFNKDDVLYVDNTMFRGSGFWRAWKLDEYGHRVACGVIPSQMRVEEELRLLGDGTDGESTARRGSTSARRSFFKRIKPQRSSSRDSKELASFSNTHLSLNLESALNEFDSVSSYQRVERLEFKYRPVLVLGPLAEFVVDKLASDYPDVFKRCMINPMRNKEALEQGLQNNTIVDYRRRGSVFECTTIQTIREAKNYHCILDICVSAVDRLQRNQIYPIVLLIRFKSAKQIKEIKDLGYSTDKISGKAVKEMYEHALKLESDYRQYISAIIPAGVVNITHICNQVKAAVDAEQKKILWVQANN